MSFDTSPVVSPELRLLRAELAAKRDHLQEILAKEKRSREDERVVLGIHGENE